MRRQELRGLAVILAAVMTGALLPWAWAQSAGPVVPGVGLADIPLGSRIAEVVQRMGAPNAVQLVNTNGTLAYSFDQYGITAYTQENIVVALTTTNSLLGLVRGVGLGSSRESVVAVFGPPRSVGLVEGFPGIMYESLGIAFGLDRHTVAVVMVFRAVAAPVQPAVPPSSPTAPASPAVTSLDAPSDLPAAATTASPAPPGPAQPVPSGDDAAVAIGSGAPVAVAPAAVVTTIPEGTTAPEEPAPATDISHLHPFTIETKYLSLAGYLRYLIYGMTRQWIGSKVGELIIHAQGSSAVP